METVTRLDRAAEKDSLVELLRRSVDPDSGALPAFLLAHPGVYQLELERIFARCWLFVAHESEVPRKGDYVTRYMGDQSVVVSRGEDERVRVFLNLCRHRGMRVCRSDLGNSSHFRCPYHGFTYRNDGELIGVPYQADAYGEVLDKSSYGLVQARVETYRGLIFATWNQHAESLLDYLSGMAWYLDLVVGRAEMEVVGPPQRWEVASTWKLPAENFISDAYHTMHTHASIAKIGLAPSLDFAKVGYHIHAGNGHGLGIGMPGPGLIFAEELLPVFQRHLTPEQYQVLTSMKNLHGTVFPNFSLLISALLFKGRTVSLTTIRQWQPKGPDRIEVYSWFVVEKDAPLEWKELSRQAYIHTFGASGIFEQDDTENWTDITANVKSPVVLDRGVTFNYQMGMGRLRIDAFPGPGEAYEGKYSEANARAFYRRWLQLLLAGEGDR